MLNQAKLVELWQTMRSHRLRLPPSEWVLAQDIDEVIVALKAAADMAEVPDVHEMPIERAIHLAKLWGAGKMIGGDQDAVIAALLKEVLSDREW